VDFAVNAPSKARRTPPFFPYQACHLSSILSSHSNSYRQPHGGGGACLPPPPVPGLGIFGWNNASGTLDACRRVAWLGTRWRSAVWAPRRALYALPHACRAHAPHRYLPRGRACARGRRTRRAALHAHTCPPQYYRLFASIPAYGLLFRRTACARAHCHNTALTCCLPPSRAVPPALYYRQEGRLAGEHGVWAFYAAASRTFLIHHLPAAACHRGRLDALRTTLTNAHRHWHCARSGAAFAAYRLRFIA